MIMAKLDIRRFGMALKPWNDDRPMTPRIVVGERSVDSRGMSLRFATERIERTTDWCCHDSSRHLIYVHRMGALRSMETNLDWGPTDRTLPRIGDTWVVPAGVRCTSVVTGDISGFCEISIPENALGEVVHIPRRKHHDPLILQLVTKIRSVAGREDALARLLLDSAGETLRLLIRDTYTTRPPATESERDTLPPSARASIIEFLETSLESDINLESLAHLAQMSVAAFIKAFRGAFHTTPYQFLLDRRIDRAKTLLSSTRLSITEISAAVGFSTPNHFATTFRQRVGLTPRDFRRGR